MYDVAVIGAGLGGLQCAYILAKRGMKVVVLEKNPYLGGCLQTFKRRGVTFDTGFHYVGGLDEGQPLNRIFKYFDLMQLPWHKMDTDGFDQVIYKGNSYMIKNGFENFRAELLEKFPSQQQSINTVTELFKNIGENIFDAFTRDQESMLSSDSPFQINASDYLNENVPDEILKNVLSGTSPKMPLTNKIPLYHFAQINASFILSAYRIKGGGMQIAEHLAESVKKMGGEVYTNCLVTKFIEKDSNVSMIEIQGKDSIEVKNVISNIHPRETMKLAEDITFVRKAQKRRYSELENSYGMFTANIALKPGKLKYLNRNIYIHESDVWSEGTQKASEKPRCALVNFAVPSDGEFAENVDILTPMLWEDVAKFDGTKPMHRPQEYEDIKAEKAQQLIELANQYVPGLKDAVDHIYTSTPLTWKDYTGTADGAAYGITKKMPFQRLANNIYWTGQNIGLHGILGVSMTSLLTARTITGEFPVNF